MDIAKYPLGVVLFYPKQVLFKKIEVGIKKYDRLVLMNCLFYI